MSLGDNEHGDNNPGQRQAALSSTAMPPDQPRTDASSRERSPDHQYTLSIEQTAELYAKAGLPRTARAIQKYCALTKLDCHKVETETGEKYLVARYSVERHIAYIKEVRPVATSRDQSRTDATVRPVESEGNLPRTQAVSSVEQPRTDATVREMDERYRTRLEDENLFLRGQVERKDKTIEALLERDRETNMLVNQLQRMLAPLLMSGKGKEPREHQVSLDEMPLQ